MRKKVAAMYKLEWNGKTITLPTFAEIPTGVVRRARKESDQEQTWFILEEMLSPKDLAILDEMPLSEFAKHMKAWTGGVPLGES
jgi:hypothetical protein